MHLSQRKSFGFKIAGFLPVLFVIGLIVFIYTEYAVKGCILPFWKGNTTYSEIFLFCLKMIPFHCGLVMMIWSYFKTVSIHGGLVPPWYQQLYSIFDLSGLAQRRLGIVAIPRHEVLTNLHTSVLPRTESELSAKAAEEPNYMTNVPQNPQQPCGLSASNPLSHVLDDTISAQESASKQENLNARTRTKHGHRYTQLDEGDFDDDRDVFSVDSENESITDHDVSMRPSHDAATAGSRSSLSAEHNNTRHTVDQSESSQQPTTNEVQDLDDTMVEYFQSVRIVNWTVASNHPYGVRWCPTCKVPKPVRAHHCSVMDECVLKMDHYCPWVANCVGFNNYKQFYLFLFYGLFCTAWVTLSWVPSMFHKNSRETRAFPSLLAVILSTSFCLTIGILFSLHTGLILRGRTTIELNHEGDFFPFDFGTRRNWELVMGKQKKLWFVPTQTEDVRVASHEGTLFVNTLDSTNVERQTETTTSGATEAIAPRTNLQTFLEAQP